jgi:hypothetical protein
MYKILQPRGENDLYVQRYGGAGLPAMNRPLVRRHPYTGRLGFNDLGIFLTKGGTITGNGLDRTDAELKSMVRQLLESQAEKSIWKHVYREGDLLIHDNISTMHARPPVTGTVPEHATRELKRITLDIIWDQHDGNELTTQHRRSLVKPAPLAWRRYQLDFSKQFKNWLRGAP